MAALTLRRVLRRGSPPASEVVAALIGDGGVRDEHDRLIVGTDTVDPNPVPLRDGDTVLGWIHGGPPGVGALLECLIALETERRDLTTDTLDRYRELALLTRLAATVGGLETPTSMAGQTLEEVVRVSEATAGIIVIGTSATPRLLAQHGEADLADAASVVLAQEGDLIEQVEADPRTDALVLTGSVVFVPLAVGGQSGTMLLHRRSAAFRSAHLKLLTAATSQLQPLLVASIAVEAERLRAEERAHALEREVSELRAALDDPSRERQIAQITDSDYFRNIRDRVGGLRAIVDGDRPLDGTT